jgi:hypothetical protein
MDKSEDTYLFQKDRQSYKSIVNAPPDEIPDNDGQITTYNVCYKRGIDFSEMSGAWGLLQYPAMPIGLTVGIGIGIRNIFTKNDIGWGMGNRVETNSGLNVISFGIGNYNKYNMFGMPLGTMGEKPTRLDPSEWDVLFGYRLGVGAKRPIIFLDIFSSIYDKHEDAYHFVVNIVGKKRRVKEWGVRGVINLKY